MEFITTGNRIAVENFEIGYFYTITMLSGNYFQACCTGIGSDFVMFSRDEPNLLFSLTMQSAADVSSIELYGGGSGTNDYNDLSNKPQINSITLIGNKSISDLGIQETISDLDTIRSGAAAGATAVQPADLATALATKQDTLSSAQLAAVNSGIDSTNVAQIETNKNNISIINILSTVTAASGYTIDSKSTLYKQGKHVFGNLIIKKSTAYSTTQYTAATLTYKPAKSYLGGAFLSPDWGVTDIGYVYIHPTSGELKLQANPAYSGSDTYMYVPLDFVTA